MDQLLLRNNLGAASEAGFPRPGDADAKGRCWERVESWRFSLAKPVSTPAAAVILNLQIHTQEKTTDAMQHSNAHEGGNKITCVHVRDTPIHITDTQIAAMANSLQLQMTRRYL